MEGRPAGAGSFSTRGLGLEREEKIALKSGLDRSEEKNMADKKAGQRRRRTDMYELASLIAYAAVLAIALASLRS